MPRTLATLLVLAVAALLAGCGSDDDQSSADAGELLSRAFDTPVESGKMALKGEVQVDGLPGLGNGVDIRMTGPFTKTGADWDVTVGGLGPGLSGGLTVTKDNVYVTFAGTSYEVGEDLVREMKRDFEEETGKDADSSSLADIGLDVERWIRDPKVEGDGEVAGAPVTRISGTLDAERVLADIARVAGEDGEQLRGLAEDGKLEISVAKSDDTIRRVALELEFEVPEDARGDFGGAEGGAVSLDVTFTDVGEPQRITPPEDARPLDDLLKRFGFGAEELSLQ